MYTFADNRATRAGENDNQLGLTHSDLSPIDGNPAGLRPMFG